MKKKIKTKVKKRTKVARSPGKKRRNRNPSKKNKNSKVIKLKKIAAQRRRSNPKKKWKFWKKK